MVLLAYLRMVVLIILLIISVAELHIVSFFAGYQLQRGFKFRRFFIRMTKWICNIQVEETGNPKVPNALYVCNHRMMMDPVVLLAHCDAIIVSKAEVANYPVLGNGTKNVGVIFVQRDNQSSRHSIKEKIGELLQSGQSIAVFPEGTVNTLPLTGDFKKGSFEEAALFQKPVIPVALDYKNTKVYWESNTSLLSHFVDIFSHIRVEAKIYFGDPIYGDDPLELLDISKQKIDQFLLEMRHSWAN